MAKRQDKWSSFDWVIGIDEAGRGPLAGPVAVGAVCYHVAKLRESNTLIQKIPAGKDSKKLKPLVREVFFKNLKQEALSHQLTFVVTYGSHRQIDKQGIVRTIANCIQQALAQLVCDPTRTLVLLDGGLRAPANFPHQQTIIRGDEKEPIIGLASIAAKVSRDRKMIALAKKYPSYGLEDHKGYGTKRHYEALYQYGPSVIHRLTFLRKIHY